MENEAMAKRMNWWAASGLALIAGTSVDIVGGVFGIDPTLPESLLALASWLAIYGTLSLAE
jgi:hypothetical protein